MKTKRLQKNRAQAAFLLATMLWLLAANAHAQEQTQHLPVVKCDTSIVRELDEQNRLVYNEIHNYPCFIKFHDNSLTAPALQLPREVKVRDFIVHEGFVYFCGSISDANFNTQAVLGYFDLQNFPVSSVQYVQVNTLKSFERMTHYVVYNTEQKLHLVMTAVASNSVQALADAYFSSIGSWRFRVSVANTEFASHRLDNLITTNNYVVLASRTHDPLTPTGHLWCFERPQVPTGNIFSVSIRHNPTNIVSLSRVLLESLGHRHGLANEYAVVFDTKFQDAFDVVRYNGIHYQNTVRVSHDYFSIYTPIDMTFDTESNSLEILLKHKVQNSLPFPTNGPQKLPHSIMDMAYPTLLAGGSVPTRTYRDETMHSLTRLVHHPGRFISSGFNNAEYTLRLYSFHRSSDGGCSELGENNSTIVDHKREFKDMELPETITKIGIPQTMQTQYDFYSIRTICNQ